MNPFGVLSKRNQIAPLTHPGMARIPSRAMHLPVEALLTNGQFSMARDFFGN